MFNVPPDWEDFSAVRSDADRAFIRGDRQVVASHTPVSGMAEDVLLQGVRDVLVASGMTLTSDPRPATLDGESDAEMYRYDGPKRDGVHVITIVAAREDGVYSLALLSTDGSRPSTEEIVDLAEGWRWTR